MPEPVRFQHFEVPLREDGSLYELGRGAMGVTYKAFDTNLRCFVALKVINATYLRDDVARQRFLREARAAAALRHPNVATVFHLGEEGGDWFYAMEYIEGETVEALMKREGAVPVPMALQITLQVARALGAAQKQGLVHRDIKPSNLMIVREDDGEFTVKVIDFGLAKNSAGSEETAALTMGGFLGTPHFASPEQLEERELDVRSDIYSLGVTLYYMLAGKAPFSGSLAQVMSQHLHREPPLESLAGQPKPVHDLLRKMLAKDPADRQQSPADLRREIDACMTSLRDHVPPAAHPVADENFDTQAIDAPPPAAFVPVPGAVLAGRYRIMNEVPASDFGRMFRGEIAVSSEPVAILILSPSLLGTGEAYTRIEEEVLGIQRVQAASVLKIHSLERMEALSFLVMEWAEGPTLLELLKVRRALPLAEAMPILRCLAEGFEAVGKVGLPCPDLSAHEIVLAGCDITRPMGMQVSAKFNALVAGGAAGGTGDATMVTSAFSILVESGAFAANPAGRFVYAVASLAYEMLGGVRSGAGSAVPVPIPGLSESANAALRRALDPRQSFASVGEFLEALGEGADALAPQGVPARPSMAAATQAGPVPPKRETVLEGGAKSGMPRLIPVLVLVAVAAAGGAGIFLYVGRGEPSKLAAQPTPTPTPAAIASPAPVTSPTPVSTPTPDPVAAALAAATAGFEADPAGSLTRLLGILKANPGLPAGREASARCLAGLSKRPLSPGQAAALREPLEEAAAMDFADAQFLLGNQLRETDPAGSLSWFLAAAKNDHAGAMVQTGLALSNKRGAIPPDLPGAAVWFQKAAQKGEPSAMYLLAECYLNSKGVTRDPRQAIELLQKAVEKNDPASMNKLGDLYKKGIPGILEPDFGEAFRLFSSAKDLGFDDALGNLGVLYIRGEGVEKNEKQGLELIQEGVRRGNGTCKFLFAMCLEEGLAGVPIDKAVARAMFIQAAAAGSAPAQRWCREKNIPFGAVPPLPAPSPGGSPGSP